MEIETLVTLTVAFLVFLLVPDAIDAVYRYSKGVPRVINVISDRCLLACYVVRVRRVDGDIVRRSFQELEGHVVPS